MSIDGAAKDAARDLGQGWKVSPYVIIQPGETFTMADYEGMGAIKHIWITVDSCDFRSNILRIYWDGQEKPAVECPLGDFFATATKEFRQISSLPVCVNPGSGLNSYWEMPFRKGFKMTLENRSCDNKRTIIYYQIDGENKEIGEDTLYFHAYFHRVNPLPFKDVYTIVDKIKGSGQYVGTYMCWGAKSNGWWGEGEIKFYIDGDSDFPTICGTGTEDYFCGSYCFDAGKGYVEYTTPYAGLSKIDLTDNCFTSQMYFNMYRWHITDPIYFKEDLKVTMQAIGWYHDGRYMPLQDDISSVAYWYSDNLEDEYTELQTRDELYIPFC